ncbi:MAG: thioredoxin family protein [Bacteroidetes bacterium]|nr:thioredoxin family protein [Bacteroidota bacterium]
MPKNKFLKLFFITLIFLFGNNISAQQKLAQHYSWTYSTEKTDDCNFVLVFTCKLDKGFHLYSQIPPKDEGPLPTAFLWNDSADFKFVGRTSEPKPIEKAEPAFDGAIIKYFENSATFRQKIHVIHAKKFKVTGEIDGMVCNDGGCFNFYPRPAFSFDVDATLCGASGATGSTGATGTTGSTGSTGTANATGNIGATGSTGISAATGSTGLIANTGTTSNSNCTVQPGSTAKAPAPKKTEFWPAFGGGFGGGLIALFMPCVLPMIPMTVSFFTKRAKNRKQAIRDGMMYAFSIVAIYVILGLIVTLATGDAQTLNQLSSNIIVNLVFFAVFILFGISFIGGFEINMPSWLVNRSDKAADQGGLIGIFFMAFTLALVSFSCTGPIIGTALVEALKVGFTGPLYVMLGFSLALALPFALFAMFPTWLKSLPKSGSWMTSMKVVFGLLEFALAMKFISNIDLSYHWGIITREIFLSIWIVCFALIGFYLMGKIKFAHDEDVPHVSVPRALLSIISFAFVVYMIPGLFGAPVRMLSGLLPPSYYSENAKFFSGGGSNISAADTAVVPGMLKDECPQNLSCFHDYDLALAYARKQKKPLFVDFTGYNCANCRRMEDFVWPDPTVLNQLRKDYVVVSLYCDDKDPLPADKQYITKDGIKIKTWGNKWSQMQIDRYGSNSQPLYVLLDNNEKMLTDSAYGYTPIEPYAKYLKSGSAEFAKRPEKDSVR